MVIHSVRLEWLEPVLWVQVGCTHEGSYFVVTVGQLQAQNTVQPRHAQRYVSGLQICV